MENSEKNNIKQRISKVTSRLLLIIILISLAVSIFYNIKLQEQIDKRDVIIEKLTQRDSILNQVFEIKYDSIEQTISYSYRTRDGKVMKYNEISNELDKLQEYYSAILNKHSALIQGNKQTTEDYNQLLNDFSSLNNNNVSLIKEYNELVLKYNRNVETTQKYILQYNNTLDSLSSFKALVDLIHSNYYVDYEILKDGKYNKISIKSEILDSALVLLPYFRDRLKKEKDTWIIDTKK